MAVGHLSLAVVGLVLAWTLPDRFRSAASRPKIHVWLPLADAVFIQPAALCRQFMSQGVARQDRLFGLRKDPELFGRGKAERVKSLGLAGGMATQLWHHLFLGGFAISVLSFGP